jgi:hypothetical protein
MYVLYVVFNFTNIDDHEPQEITSISQVLF